MPTYTYKARNPRGDLVNGKLESNSSETAAEELLRSGLTPVEIKSQANAVNADLVMPKLFAEKITPAELMLFARQMASLLKAGVPILRALSSLSESGTHKVFQSVLHDIRDGLTEGRELSACLRQHPAVFPPFFVNMVRVGETTGRLDEVFMRLFQHLEFEKMMHEQVQSAVRYPTFVVVALVAAISVINIFVIPAFAKVYKSSGSDLPLMTRILLTVSDWTVAYWPMLFGGAFLAFLAFRWWKLTPEGNKTWDGWMLHFPIAGKIVQKAALARFAKGLAMTYQSGVPIVQGLTNAAQVVGNLYVAGHIEQMRNAVERGDSITRSARATGVFTPVVLQMMAVGEETGELDRLLMEVGEMYQREVEYEIKTLSEQIEPILIVGLGSIVLVVALGVFLPVWDMSSTMSKK